MQLAAASWYAAHGRPGAAEKHAQIALSLKPGLDRRNTPGPHLPADGTLPGCRLHPARGRDDQSGRRGAWYSLALAYRRSADVPKAISSFATALQLRPDDEVPRIAQEATAVDSLPMDDAQRKKMAPFTSRRARHGRSGASWKRPSPNTDVR